MTEQLNNPVAVIAILAGLAVFLREMSWFVRSIQGKNPTDELRVAVEKFVDASQALSITLTRMHDKLERVEKVVDRIDERARS